MFRRGRSFGRPFALKKLRCPTSRCRFAAKGGATYHHAAGTVSSQCFAVTLPSAESPASFPFRGSEAEAAATEWAAANNGVTLAMTQAGQDVAAATQDMAWTAAQPLWNAASADFAAAASGDVQAFISSSASFDSIFFQTELPILLDSPSVSSITITF